MKAIILSAGFGSRMRPLTEKTHKSLLPVANMPIMKRMIQNIINVGITDIIIVTGYRASQVKKFAKKNFPDITFTFIHNQNYLTTNTGYSLLLTRPYVNGDAIVKFDADVVFEQAILEKLINSPVSALCIDRNIHLDKEEVKAIIDAEGKVIAVGKKLNPKKASGESIGIEMIENKAVKVLYAELAELMKDPKNHQEYYDDSYTTLVKRGVPFTAVDITGLKWVEVDCHEDYARSQEMFSIEDGVNTSKKYEVHKYFSKRLRLPK